MGAAECCRISFNFCTNSSPTQTPSSFFKINGEGSARACASAPDVPTATIGVKHFKRIFRSSAEMSGKKRSTESAQAIAAWTTFEPARSQPAEGHLTALLLSMSFLACHRASVEWQSYPDPYPVPPRKYTTLTSTAPSKSSGGGSLWESLPKDKRSAHPCIVSISIGMLCLSAKVCSSNDSHKRCSFSKTTNKTHAPAGAALCAIASASTTPSPLCMHGTLSATSPRRASMCRCNSCSLAAAAEKAAEMVFVSTCLSSPFRLSM
mmetsp:Transcript_10458/g.23712  ORF Transcript_10458/g.23712 Transcript_10458/m.23712 type:complete len:264 (-) Transcript_10458:484-1275(-)